MISIRKATTDLDRMEDLLAVLAASFEQAIRSTAQYAIELNPADTEVFRQHLEGLRSQLVTNTEPDAWKAVEASFRGELRDYRDKASEHLKQLRGEITAAIEAMQVFGDEMNASSADHEVHIKKEMGDLSSLARGAALEELRAGIQVTAESVSNSVESMRRSHQVAVLQMRDEIRLLHAQIDVERRAAYMDRATGVWNRQKLESHLAALIANDQPFCVLLVCVRNLKHLDQKISKNLIAGTLRAFLQRFSAMLGDNVVMGRWNEEHFVAILEDSSTAMQISRHAATRLTGTYSVQENGLSHSVPVQAIAGVVERQTGMGDPLLQQRMLQMAQALLGQ